MALADLIPLGPTGLPEGFENARFPAVYERAKQALAECARIDECKDWANKAEALASYFQQSKNEQMMKDCRRIQARAIERCGELLRQIESGQGKVNQHTVLRDGTDLKQPTRESVASAATSLKVSRQKAMATAMAFPNGSPGKRNDLKPLDLKSEGYEFSEKTLSRARYVLRNSPMVEGERYPRMLNGIQAAFPLSTFPSSRSNSAFSVPVADTIRPRRMPAR